MKKLCLLALPLLAVALPSQAAAQDADPAAGGFRIDLMAGFDSVRADVEGDDNNETFRGAVYGVGIGYDMPLGAVDFGIDAEATFTTSDRTITQGELALGRDLYVGGRLTGHVSNSVSVYGKAGYTNLGIRTDLNANQTVPDLGDVRGTLNGVRGAIGIQISASDNDEQDVYYGVEARYSNYESGVTRRQAMLVIGARF
jgi:outer membrane immunogenic protein